MPDVVRYLEFALALTSLIVSLVAVFQTFLSDSSLRESTDRVQNASTTLSLATDKIQKSVDDLIEQAMGVKAAIVKHSELLSAPTETTSTSSPVISDELAFSFLKRSSVIGLISIKTAYESNKTGKSFELKNLFSDEWKKYCHGFLIACRSVGLINEKIINGVWSISYVHPVICSEIDSLLDNRLSKLKNPGPGKSILSAVTAFFNETD